MNYALKNQTTKEYQAPNTHSGPARRVSDAQLYTTREEAEEALKAHLDTIIVEVEPPKEFHPNLAIAASKWLHVIFAIMIAGIASILVAAILKV